MSGIENPQANPIEKPIIVQSDWSIMLDTHAVDYEAARDALAGFAEIINCLEHYHNYKFSPLSLWNAASAGLTADDILASLRKFSRYPIPQNVEFEIREHISRFGRLKLVKEDEQFVLESADPLLLEQLWSDERIKQHFEKKLAKNRVLIRHASRGLLKVDLIKKGFPVEDLAGYEEGEQLAIELRNTTARNGQPFALREYQRESVIVFYQQGRATGGSGVLVLPCGAGKTIIGMGIMQAVSQHTLIVVTNITALHQWRDEILDKTNLRPEDIGEYSGEVKDIKPITITTYQILTYRKRKEQDFTHMGLFDMHKWGLIIYDEVHLLPAPVFRAVADIQGKRRLGLTATLLREDGKESNVFSLIGPKKIDIPWKILERQGWIAQAICIEVRIALPDDATRYEYAVADAKAKFRLASENPAKIQVLRELINRHPDDQILIIGQYLDQLDMVAAEFGAPIITGKTPNKERDQIYADFKTGKIHVLIVSKVANFSVDLPDASVALQISGTFGSRQEEAQRLGRVLRPKRNGNMAHFYTLVTRDSRERDFALNRQKFLAEQGYLYRIINDLAELDERPGNATVIPIGDQPAEQTA